MTDVSRTRTPTAAVPGPLWALFSFHGRLGREPYWLGMILTYLLASVGGINAFSSPPTEPVEVSAFMLVSLITAAVSQLAIMVKRLHDRGFTGWLVLAPLGLSLPLVMTPFFGQVATFLNLAFLVALGIIPGTPGPNRFGPATNRRGR